MTAVLTLDEFGWAMYRKLSAEATLLSQLRNAIKCKKKLIQAYLELWLEFEAGDFDDADKVYELKYKLELELLQLEVQEREQSEKVRLRCSR